MPVRCYLALFHRLEQGALGLRRCSIDLIGEHELREYRALVKLKTTRLPAEYGNADDIRGQQVARELNALVAKPQRARQRMGEGRFSDTRKILDQEMPCTDVAARSYRR